MGCGWGALCWGRRGGALRKGRPRDARGLGALLALRRAVGPGTWPRRAASISSFLWVPWAAGSPSGAQRDPELEPAAWPPHTGPACSLPVQRARRRAREGVAVRVDRPAWSRSLPPQLPSRGVPASSCQHRPPGPCRPRCSWSRSGVQLLRGPPAAVPPARGAPRTAPSPKPRSPGATPCPGSQGLSQVRAGAAPSGPGRLPGCLPRRRSRLVLL